MGGGIEIDSELHSHKVLLPPEYKDIHLENGAVITALFEYPKGCVHWDRFELSDLPNNLISFNDMERFGVFPCLIK